MANIGPKEAALRALRDLGHVCADRKAPPAPKKQETDVKKKQPTKKTTKKTTKKKAAPKRKAQPKRKAAPRTPRTTSAPKEEKKDRSPRAVGEFLVAAGADGRTMDELEAAFGIVAHPMRSKIHAARHQLGYGVTYDAKAKRYVATAPKPSKPIPEVQRTTSA